MATSVSGIEPRVQQEETLLAWRAPARPFKSGAGAFMKTPMVIAVLIGLVLLIAMEWMLIIVLAALIFAYYAWSMVPPEMVEYQLTSRGVRVNEKLYEWEGMYRWWMNEQWGQKMLMIETPLSLVGTLALLLGDASPDKVEAVMERMLLKDKPADTGMDKAGKWLSQKFPLGENVKV